MRFFFSLLVVSMLSQISFAQKTVFLEKFSNSHCGNCPNATLNIQEIVEENENVVWVTHYKPFFDNPVNNPESDQLWFDFNLFGVPSILVDRTYNNGLFPSSSQWENRVKEELEKEQTVSLEIFNLVANTFTNELSFEVDVKFLSEVEEGEYRISYMFVEDKVTGEPQDNYYNNVEGHPHYGLGNEIWNYEHRNVVRHIADDAWGSQLDLLISPDSDTEFVGGVSYPVEAHFDIEEMFVVAVISKYNPDNLEDIEVLQAAQMQVLNGFITDTEEVEAEVDFSLYPNPSNNFIQLDSQSKIDKLIIYNAVGQRVLALDKLDQSNNIDVSFLPNGSYTAVIKTDQKQAKRKFSILR